jgi:hypothetical protein
MENKKSNSIKCPLGNEIIKKNELITTVPLPLLEIIRN